MVSFTEDPASICRLVISAVYSVLSAAVRLICHPLSVAASSPLLVSSKNSNSVEIDEIPSHMTDVNLIES